MKRIFLLFSFLSISLVSLSQSASIQGYVFESGNRGYLENILIEVFDQRSDTLISKCSSNKEGFFSCTVPLGQKLTVVATHEYFFETRMTSSSLDLKEGGKAFLKLELKRSPGYMFEITMAEERLDENLVVDAIKSAKIEVYNNTIKEMVLLLEDYQNPDFKVHLKKGNHYTIMIRRPGYLTKRMEAFVDVKGCILCFEGIGEVKPGVTDNLTGQNSFGTLLANVELKRIYPDMKIKINTIYYAPASYELSSLAKIELENLRVFMTDNPDLIIELGSHTDSRGDHLKNQELSRQRAQTAVDYVLQGSSIDPSRLIAKGYGFTKILNDCQHGVVCSEEDHALNRRTELRLIGVLNDGQYMNKSLASMKQMEHMDELLKEIQNEGIIEIPSDVEIPVEERKSKRAVKKINEEFDQKSEDIKESVSNVVSEIIGTEERTFEDFEDTQVEKVKEETLEEIEENQSLSNQDEVFLEVSDASNQEADLDESFGENIENKSNAPVDEEEEEIQTIPISAENEDWMNGHKIVLFDSKKKVAKSHPVYKEYKKVYVMESPVSKKLMYIVGEFQSKELAESFLEEKVYSKFPGAYLISF